jgi:AraC family transcriptional regulator
MGKAMLIKSSPTNGASSPHFAEDAPRLLKSDGLLAMHRSPPIDGGRDERIDCDPPRRWHGWATADAIYPAVEISPSDIVRRRTMTGHGMAAETVQCASRDEVQYRCRAPMHLLVAYEEGERSDGETFVEGLPRSTLRNFARKLTFVPAGHEFREWHKPRAHTRLMYFYFDPAKLKLHSGLSIANISFTPRLFFEDATLWHTAHKLKSLLDRPASQDGHYFEALGVVFVHELVRLNCGTPSIQPQVRGGLAAWQQRIVTAYIEEHLSERIELATLAQLVGLSRSYFCRAFKQSLGMPPHRYQNNRRLEHAKLLLAKPACSVTDIGVTMGFSETSSFSAAFRKATGFTPTAYHRNVG